MRVIDADTIVNENDLFNIFKIKLSNRPQGIGSEFCRDRDCLKLLGGGNPDFLSNEILAGIIFISVRDQKKVMQISKLI